MTKVPYQTNGQHASSTKPETWAYYEDVWDVFDYYECFDGIGFVFTQEDDFVFIDIDHCINGDELSEKAKDILNVFHDQYVEVSQSGEGLHIIVRGHVPRSFKNTETGVECYDCKRFVAMTGNALSPHEPHEEQNALDYFFNMNVPEKRKTSARRSCGYGHVTRKDEDIIQKAREHGTQFRILYDKGDWQGAGYSSQSEADLALCLLFAFWTDRDPVAIDRLFRSSGLYRPKWERRDYAFGSSTQNGTQGCIPLACKQCLESLSEWQDRKRKEEVMCIVDFVPDDWK